MRNCIFCKGPFHSRLKRCMFLIVLTFLALGVWVKVKSGPESSSRVGFQNHFQNKAQLFRRGLLINTTNCQIPDIDPWDDEIKPLIQRDFPYSHDCSGSYDRIFSKYSTFQNNVLTLPEMKHSWSQLPTCCYKIITRHNNATIADKDDIFNSSDCIPIKSGSVANISTEFVAVQCSAGHYWMTDYNFYHGVATPDNNQRSAIIQEKLEFWTQKEANKDSLRPPNILIIALDSTTRLNFRRQMPQMTSFLEKLGAVEMFGYTKIGDKTFKNLIAAFTGYSSSDYQSISQRSSQADPNNFLFSRFDKAHYLTSFVEDTPIVSVFNYIKGGFAIQPLDFYPRPLFHAADLPIPDADACIGPLRADEALIKYTESVQEFAVKVKVPVFNFMWSTYNSHNDLNGVQRGDGRIAKMLQGFQVKSQLKNCIVIVLGDHGMTYGPITSTLIGRNYENNLPVFWIALPEEVRKRYPDWEEAVQINSRRLTSPFLVYWTFNKILETFTRITPPTDVSPSLVRKHRYNFLEPVPENLSCSDVGVPDPACACHFREEIIPEDPLLWVAANAALDKINSDVVLDSGGGGSIICANLTLAKVTAGSVLDKVNDKILQISVSFLTRPEEGGFEIQAMVNYSPLEKRVLEVIDYKRTSKMNPDHVKCLSEIDILAKKRLQLVCYCVM